MMELKVVLAPSEGGGFAVYVPALPGCVSEGQTREEALKNIQKVIQLYLTLVQDSLGAQRQ
jgi:predicted RNase H-like HicB family nuclease